MKKSLSILLALIMLLSLCGCGASSLLRTASSDYAVTEEASEDIAYAYDGDSAAYGGFSNYSGSTDTTSASAAQSEASEEALPEVDPEKIIYSAEATVETTDFEGTLAKVTELVKQYSGYVESSSINGANYYNVSRGDTTYRSASYTLRIPSTSFNTVMSGLSDLGNVPYTYTYTENVTTQYYDTQARLTAYQTQETSLLEMMEKAETVEDIIKIEDKLTELRYQIESLQSTLKNWDRQVSYSTVYLNINEVSEYTPESGSAKTSYAQRLLNSLKSSLQDIGSFFADLLVWFVGALPVIIILCIVAAVIVILIKRGKKKRAAKKAAANDADKATQNENNQ